MDLNHKNQFNWTRLKYKRKDYLSSSRMAQIPSEIS